MTGSGPGTDGGPLTGGVVILTAGMGAGHDRVAVELQRRLLRRGIPAETLDIWTLLPWRLGSVITGFYRAVIHRAPWLYQAIYAIWLAPGGESARRASPLIRLAGRHLGRWMEIQRPAVAVSTFHLCSQVLGDMRRRGLLAVPTASIVVDFAAHGLWVDPDVDVHFCLHPDQAQRVEGLGAPRAVAAGPVVSEAFRRPGSGTEKAERRRLARLRFGFRPDYRVVLIGAGSWGAGPVERAARVAGRDGRFRVVVVAGHNEALVQRLRAIGSVEVHGWVDDMAELMEAADVLVENAGGLMAMEAMAVGTPVVSFEPIPGHGRVNVELMDRAGISVYARSEAELLRLLADVTADGPQRTKLVDTAGRMFCGDPADEVAGMALGAGAGRAPA